MRKAGQPKTLIGVVLVGIFLLLLREASFLPRGTTQLAFLDIGQGDSILIVSPSNKTIIIDGGPDVSTLEYLGKHLSFFNRHIDLLVLSHPDLDHLASFPEILKRYDVDALLFPATDFNSSRYSQILAIALEKNSRFIPAKADQTINMGDGFALDVLWPTENWSGKNKNNASVVTRASFGNHSVLFTGDIEEDAERELLALGFMIKSDTLKVAHHGSKTSTSTGFLLAVQPTAAIISAGRNNGFGHPHGAVVKRLYDFSVEILRTDELGTVEMEWK